ncbi:MAG: IclR family transcriptional regulator [Roseovarius sp.]|nr:IclR family transcriptional regulator [Roseovarius sp.]
MATSHEDETATGRRRDGPMSLLRTLNILEHVAAQEEAMPLARLSEALDLPKSSLLGLLRALTRHRYLVQEGGRYALGPSAHRLAVAILPGFSLTRLARPVLRELAARSGETALLGLLDRATARMVYVEVCDSARVVRYTVPVGTTRPLYCTAGGRVLLAWQPAGWFEDYLARMAASREPLAPPFDAQAVRAAVARVRREGVSITRGDFLSEVAGVAAPVFDGEGAIAGVLMLGLPIERGRARIDALEAMVREAAAGLSRDLGFSGGPGSVAPKA